MKQFSYRSAIYLILATICIIFAFCIFFRSKKFVQPTILAKSSNKLTWVTQPTSSKFLTRTIFSFFRANRCKYKVWGWDNDKKVNIANSCNLYNLYEYDPNKSNSTFRINKTPDSAKKLEGNCPKIDLTHYIESNDVWLKDGELKKILSNSSVKINKSLQGFDKNVVFSPNCKMVAIRIEYTDLPSDIFILSLQ